MGKITVEVKINTFGTMKHPNPGYPSNALPDPIFYQYYIHIHRYTLQLSCF